jgi:hypothetical protein
MPFVYHFLSLPPDLHAELQDLAKQQGRSFSDFVITSLLKSLEEHQVVPPKKSSQTVRLVAEAARRAA